MSDFDLSRFQQLPVMGIVRGVTQDSLDGTLNALIDGGLRHVEITLNTENALGLIETAAKKYSTSVCIGAGTVLNLGQAKRAVEAGANFIVAPTLNEEVAAYCRENAVAYFPGALTPSEIENAANAGAVMVKVFPAQQMGAEYFKVVKGPLENIKLLAVGGVNHKNVSDYLAAGADGVALGGSIISISRMENKEFSAVRNDVEEFLLAMNNFYSKMR